MSTKVSPLSFSEVYMNAESVRESRINNAVQYVNTELIRKLADRAIAAPGGGMVISSEWGNPLHILTKEDHESVFFEFEEQGWIISRVDNSSTETTYYRFDHKELDSYLS